MTAPADIITTRAHDFADSVGGYGRLMALDVGSKTIGIAYCDASWSFATASHTLKRGKFGANKAVIVELLKAQNIVGIVIGLPLNMDGSDSPQTQSVRAFARNMIDCGLPILLWDERWSTQAVERAMVAADISRAKRAERVDAAAAAFILQGAIDAMAGAAPLL